LGETKVELQTGHLVLEDVKLFPPNGDVDRPEVLLAEPVLALSREAAEELPEETPEEEKACGKVSNPWSELSQRARAPLRLSMEGVGELISPDFCLTIPLLAQSWDYNKPFSR